MPSHSVSVRPAVLAEAGITSQGLHSLTEASQSSECQLDIRPAPAVSHHTCWVNWYFAVAEEQTINSVYFLNYSCSGGFISPACHAQSHDRWRQPKTVWHDQYLISWQLYLTRYSTCLHMTYVITWIFTYWYFIIYTQQKKSNFSHYFSLFDLEPFM